MEIRLNKKVIVALSKVAFELFVREIDSKLKQIYRGKED